MSNQRKPTYSEQQRDALLKILKDMLGDEAIYTHYQGATRTGSKSLEQYRKLVTVEAKDEWQQLSDIIAIAKAAVQKRQAAGKAKRKTSYTGKRQELTELHQCIAQFPEKPEEMIKQLRNKLMLDKKYVKGEESKLDEDLLKTKERSVSEHEGLKVGDIIIFKPNNVTKSFGDKFIQFLQRLTGRDHSDYVHAAIVARVDDVGPHLAQYTSEGFEVRSLSETAYLHHHYQVVRPEGKLLENIKEKMKEENERYYERRLAKAWHSEHGKTRYAWLKSAAAFLRKEKKYQGKANKQKRSDEAEKLVKKGRSEEVCSTYVAGILKDCGANSVTTDLLMPNDLMTALSKSSHNSRQQSSDNEFTLVEMQEGLSQKKDIQGIWQLIKAYRDDNKNLRTEEAKEFAILLSGFEPDNLQKVTTSSDYIRHVLACSHEFMIRHPKAANRFVGRFIAGLKKTGAISAIDAKKYLSEYDYKAFAGKMASSDDDLQDLKNDIVASAKDIAPGLWQFSEEGEVFQGEIDNAKNIFEIDCLIKTNLLLGQMQNKQKGSVVDILLEKTGEMNHKKHFVQQLASNAKSTKGSGLFRMFRRREKEAKTVAVQGMKPPGKGNN